MSIHPSNGPCSLFSLWILAAIAVFLPSQSKAQSTTINYTGRLMGYYRIEANEQIWNSDGTPSDHLLKPVRDFLNWRKENPQLLVGMGDNFGPEFGASIQPVGADDCLVPAGKGIAPGSLYKDGTRIPKSAHCDNVLRFLMAAGFRAVVPGREDFMYSAAWLQGVAHLAKNQSSGDEEHSLFLLASNLRVATSKGKCPLLFADHPFSSDATNCTPDNQPDIVDWLERMDKLRSAQMQAEILHQMTPCDKTQNISECNTNAQLVRATQTTVIGNQVKLMFAAWRRFYDAAAVDKFVSKELDQYLREGSEKKLALGLLPQPVKPPPAEWTTYQEYLKTALDTYYQLSKKGNYSGPLAKLALTDELIAAVRTGLLQEIAKEQDKVGYTLVGKVLLIGVVGQETMQSISVENAALCQAEPLAIFPFSDCPPSKPSQQRSVKVFEPVSAVTSILEAVEAANPQLDSIVLMAQMPQSEALELGARVRGRVGAKHLAPVNVILCEPQQNHSTPAIKLTYEPSEITPILASASTYGWSEPVPQDAGEEIKKLTLPGSVSTVVLSASDHHRADDQHHAFAQQVAFHQYSVDGQHNSDYLSNTIPYRPPVESSAADAWKLLMGQLPPPSPSCSSSEVCRAKSVLAIIQSMQRTGHFPSDVVLLERRDLFLEDLPDGYVDYDLCIPLSGKDKSKCQLRIALDRVLWKGDYLEQVAVTGKDLLTMLKKSDDQQAQRSSLATKDISQEWLVTYGIVQGPLSNLTNIGTEDDPLWLPQDPSCKATKDGGVALYCVNGRPIADDQIYWVTTTDQFAEQNPAYPETWAIQSHDTRRRYVTEVISNTVIDGPMGAGLEETFRANPSGTGESLIAKANRDFQQSPLFEIDFSKLILTYSSSSPEGGDVAAQQFQGAADARAATPHKAEFDLEGATRLTGDFSRKHPLAGGIMSTGAYDRSVQGNLTGKPESVSYSQNSFSIGGFVQFRLPDRGAPRSTRSLPRNLIVLTPHQYQQQVNNQRVFLPFTVGTGQLTIPLPRATSFTDKIAIRREWGVTKSRLNLSSGSYIEGGMEFSLQNNVLRSLTLMNPGGATLQCFVSGSQSLNTCFSNAKATFPIGPQTVPVGKPDVETLHTPGAYWDAHIERRYGSGFKQVTIVSESVGEILFGRPASAVLPTQTNYAIPWSVSLVFPVWGNLSVAPTYNAFFYRGQLSGNHLQTNSYAIALRWYFARDERVPPHRQLWVTGPASADQTKTGKSK